jgi:benzoate-CoA ligase family protein
VPVNTLLRAADYPHMVEDSGCAIVAYSPEVEGEVGLALAAASHKPRSALKTEGQGSLRTLMASAGDTLAAAPATADGDCFWLYSSGSTGRPKGAVHRHRDLVATCVHYAVGILGMAEDDVCFSAAKLFFAYGLGNAMTFPLWVGGTAILSDQRPSPEMTFDLIQRFRPSLFFGVPTLYAAQLRDLESRSVDFSSLRACVSAGEALPADILRRWREKTGLPILDGIGSTEALHIFISNRPDDYRPGTSGRPVPGYAAKILGEDEKPVPRGQTGRLLVKGDSIARCYWNNPEMSAETMLGEWINTGDTFLQDEDGYFFFVDRKNDFMRRRGENISSFEVEKIINSHPSVLESAVYAIPSALGEDEVMVAMVLQPGAELDPVELMQYCEAHTAYFMVPRYVRCVDAFPKTGTERTMKYQLRSQGVTRDTWDREAAGYTLKRQG